MATVSPNTHLHKFTTNLALLAVVFFVFVIVLAIYIRAEKRIDRANELRYQSYLLADELRQSSDDLTRMVRAYVSTGNPIFKQHYQEILDIREGKKPRPVQYDRIYWDLVLADDKRPRPNGEAIALLELMRQAGFSESEFAALEKAKINSDILTAREFAAMAMIESSSPISDSIRMKSILMLQDDAYRQAKAGIMEPINNFFQLMEERALKEIRHAEQVALLLRILVILFAFLLAYLLWSSYRTLYAILGCKVDELHHYISRIGSGDFSFPLPVIKSSENSVLGWLSESQKKLFQLDLERKKAENSLRESDDRYRRLFDSSIDGVLLTSPDGRIMEANPAACKMFQRTEQEIVLGGRNAIVDTSDPNLTLSLKERNETGKFMGELTLLRKDGTKFIGEVSTSVFINKDGETRTSMIIRDVTQRKQLEDQVHQLAFFDFLTKLPNRRLLDDRLGQAMAASKRSSRYGAVMFLDLDNFKPLNDTHGHAVGDLLLIEVARRIGGCIRETDTAARFGGDEFVVMLNELEKDKAESISQASIVAEKIRVTLAEPYLLTMQNEGSTDFTIEHHCSSSIGVVLFIDHEASMDDIFKWADMAMYQAKEDGRNMIRFYGKESKG
jgi:diguanylate cyclase (GGDEF)-like protein/PAS domain S-box-containing protein